MKTVCVLALLACVAMPINAADKVVQVTVSLNVPGDDAVLSNVVTQQVKYGACATMPVQPCEPSMSDAGDPRRLIHYFCRRWKDEEYGFMYMAMTPAYRKSVSLKEFTALFEADAERTGGLKDENIFMDDVDEGKKYYVTLSLCFNYARARERRVKVVLEKGKQGYRIMKSGIIPLDLNNL